MRVKNKQSIYVVDRLKVIHWINHQSQFTIIPCSFYWGTLQSGQELIDAINSLKRTPNDKIDMSRVAQCIQSFYTSKLIGGANNMLKRIWILIKMDREKE